MIQSKLKRYFFSNHESNTTDYKIPEKRFGQLIVPLTPITSDYMGMIRTQEKGHNGVSTIMELNKYIHQIWRI